HLQAPGAPLATGAFALGARLLDHGAVPVAARTRVRETEEALALDRHAAALALGADDRRGAGLRARAAALTAGDLGLDGGLRLDPAQGILERNVQLDTQV